jgi:hypothetical protein
MAETMTGKCQHCGGKVQRYWAPILDRLRHKSTGYPYVVHEDDCPGRHDFSLGLPFVLDEHGEPTTCRCVVEAYGAHRWPRMLTVRDGERDGDTGEKDGPDCSQSRAPVSNPPAD